MGKKFKEQSADELPMSALLFPKIRGILLFAIIQVLAAMVSSFTVLALYFRLSESNPSGSYLKELYAFALVVVLVVCVPGIMVARGFGWRAIKFIRCQLVVFALLPFFLLIGSIRGEDILFLGGAALVPALAAYLLTISSDYQYTVYYYYRLAAWRRGAKNSTADSFHEPHDSPGGKGVDDEL